jgi:hypothetical protein
VKRKRKIVRDQRNLVGLGGFVKQGSRAPAIRTFEVLEDHDGDLSSSGRPENWINWHLGKSAGG